MKVQQEVLEVLERLLFVGEAAKIQEQLDRKLYLAVNKVLEACGGKWNRKAACHQFGQEARPLIESVLATGQVQTKADIGFFPTPAALADRLAEMAGIKESSVVLEPSAGTGNLVRAAIKRGGHVIAIERDPKMRRELVAWLEGASTGTVVDIDDFLDTTSQVSPGVDVVLMNPPFVKVGKGDHLDHVRHAFGMLMPGGTLVSVLPVSVEFRQDRRYREFREWVEENGGEIDRLPDGSFEESGTGVNTCVLRIVHP